MILQKYMTESLKIGEKYQGQQYLIVGQSPLGFPVNIKLEKQPPPALHEITDRINSHLYHLDAVNDNFFPLLYINLTTYKDHKFYKVCNLSYLTSVVKISFFFLLFFQTESGSKGLGNGRIFLKIIVLLYRFAFFECTCT